MIRPSTIWTSREKQAQQNGVQKPEGPWPAPVLRFLQARGITKSDEIENLFSPKLSALTDPMKLLGMGQAVDRIVKAYREQEKICIYADFDLDGTSGLALLYTGLKQLGFSNVLYYQPKRLSEGYGFHPHAVEDLHKQGVTLIVTVDVGITAIEACDTAKALGVDVIVTDHHLAGAKLPDAFVVVNPNQKDCNSGLGYLCGAGVAFYLLRAVNRGLVEAKLVEQDVLDLKSLLDFFTIGTLTDLVPLVGDNRPLVRQGLKVLEKTSRAGLLSLLRALNLDGRPLSSQDVGIRFSPKLNALSRLESHILPINIFLETDHERAESLVDQVLSLNSDRVALQASGETEAIEQLKTWNYPGFVFASSKNFHRGILGLIATKLAQEFNRPAFVGSESADGVIVGSARTGGGLPVLGALGKSSSMLHRFGGHDSAAGFELLSSNKDEFITALNSYYEKQLYQSESREVLYDLDLPIEEMNDSLQNWFESLGPFGQGFPVPFFLTNNITVISKSTLKGGHLKLGLKSSEQNRRIEALYFSPPKDLDVEINDQVQALVEMQWNFFAGQKKLQLLVKEILVQRLLDPASDDFKSEKPGLS